MPNTGFILPQSVETAAESPWLDNDWVDPANVFGAGEASITDNTFDNGDQSYVLKTYNFDLSSIPAGATIDGVVVRINARCSVNADIDLVQLLNTSRAKVGDNKAATPQNVVQTAADYDFGGSTDKWNNALTDTWVKNSNFGVAVGMMNLSNLSLIHI